ncbi:hypothetical protein HNQ85_003072 [Anoxybacillus calidus]|jgi:hypothetical protein|uniref:DUF2922 domain-containing protein n=1 Tax=[Anoxybacillus] calidus TaxID=575178 RepID=A0A7V9Z2K1_9BACL|nr:DUF2922 domain-containing protein [Anoxybacillus calidus]MBA2872760.1 hypothetical protein [Anoxybacillus calidus]
MVEKALELQFLNQAGKIVRILIENPIEPINAAAVSTVMDAIITANVFVSSGGDLVAKKGARLLASEVTELVLA